ncbi:carcinoembryonic antigen-related cell adhesion molecule 5-like [Lineus longissimus]|uniref:carcinoembryonic antigen-related cell adhesion molecule 5-like n=1 Tax=Lineus longissimus TaxID=88925 RepID=UPI00315DE5BC
MPTRYGMSQLQTRLFPPEKPSLRDASESVVSEITVNLGETFTFRCVKGAGGVDPDSYQFYKGGNRATDGVTGATFSKAAVKSDGGWYYKCKAVKDGLVSVASVGVVLTVKVPPDKPLIKNAADQVITSLTLNAGEIFSFTCAQAASGVVPDAWEVFHDDAKIATGVTGATLSQTVAGSDAGSYTCKALKEGLASAASDTLALTVNVPPDKPLIKNAAGIVMTSLTLNAGETFSFTCTQAASGVVPDAWESFHDDVKTATGVTGAALSKTVAGSDAGSYTCKALKAGLASVASDTLALTVKVPPDKPLIKNAAGIVMTSLTLNAGETFSFTCTKAASGMVPDAWEVFHDDVKIATGVTGATLSQTVAGSDEGSYTCKALKAGLASAASDTLALTVNVPPDKPLIKNAAGIVMTSLTLNAGETFSFTCTKAASGVVPDAWEVSHDDVKIATGVTGATLSKMVAGSDAGSYTCKALKAGLASAASDTLALTVKVPPDKPLIKNAAGIVMTSLTLNAGETFSFTCTKAASGVVPDAWESFHDDVKIATGVTGAALSKTVAGSDAGSYTCKALKEGLASVASDTLALTVNVPPDKPLIKNAAGIVMTSLTLNAGETFSFTCTKAASGVVPDAWEVSHDDVKIATGVTGATLSKTVAGSDAGSYTCKALKAGLASAASDTLALTVKVPPDKPLIKNAAGIVMTSLTLNAGETFSFTCTKAASGVVPDAWEVSHDDVKIATGVTGATLSKTVAGSDAGSYTCKALKAGLASAASDTLALTVKVPPDKPLIKNAAGIVMTSLTLNAGETFSFTCTKAASGVVPDAWESFHDDVKIATGVTGATLSKTVAGSDAGSYTCKALKEGLASAASDTLALTVNVPPDKPLIKNAAGIVMTSLTLNAGETFSFTCTKAASGVVPDTWELFYGGVKTATGVTGATLSKTVAGSDAGSYTCKALKAGLASETSEILALTVNVPPDKPLLRNAGGQVVTTATVYVGETITFTCTQAATGVVPDAWEFYKDSNKDTSDVIGATFSKTAVLADGGLFYKCLALKGGLASVASDTLLLTVLVFADLR